MKRRFTNSEKVAGEIAVRYLSEKAYRNYSGADPLSVYEYTNADDETVYAASGIVEADDITKEELERLLEGLEPEEEDEEDN